jgi:acetate kinase
MTVVFVVNSGSSSIKWDLIDVESHTSQRHGLIERIGEHGGSFVDHRSAMADILAQLGDSSTIAAVGHRVVHGGSIFAEATLITPDVEAQIDDLSSLAPLHNPANLEGIRAARSALPDVPHVAVFDTAFHQTLAPAAYSYAIDARIAEQFHVRRYGFHGTSHRYVSGRAAEFLGRSLESLKLIVFHLGNGASACAIDGGRSIDTSMGMTPLEGLVMGTRSGDLDPGALFHLNRESGMGVDELDDLLNRRSGLLGLTGHGDMRDVQATATRGDAAARLALAVYAHRLRHYLGAYLMALGRVDAIVFTAGVGENSASTRADAVAGLEHFGILLDDDRNRSAERDERRISADGSPVEVLVIPTNEELEIARQTLALTAR